jgi:nucleoside phosphorylase
MRPIDTIVVPQGAEYQAVCRGLQQAKVKSTRVLSIPIGTENIEGVLTGYAQQLVDSRRILIMGLCGSLDSYYGVGDAIVVKSCYNSNHVRINLEPKLTTIIQNKLSLDAVDGFTSDRVITQAAEKLTIANKYLASIVDMEGYGYISRLQQQGAVAMLRVVSDDVGGNIPDITKAIDSQGKLKTIALAIALLKQPIAATRLIGGSLIGLKTLQRITTKLYID